MPVLALTYVLLVAATLAYFILRIPIQVSDGFGNMVDVLDDSLLDIFVRKATNRNYFRPLMWPQYRVVMDWSGGAYQVWFKGLQAAQVGLLLLLFVRWLRVRTPADLVALPCGVAMLVGAHTFAGTVMEAFPINHFLSVAVCCLAAATVAAEPRRRLNDVLVLGLFVFAVLTLESGLLVWIITIAARLLGWRGISSGAAALMTIGVLAYAGVRLFWLDTGTPDLMERATGFGFSTLDPEELVRRFGAHPVVLYAYNVSGAISSVLFAEPRGGVWRFTRGLVIGPREAWTQLNVLCASGATLLVAVAMWRRRLGRRWRTPVALAHEDRVLLMAGVVLVANAAFCYAYLKDVILAPAGVFLAAAAYVGVRDAVSALSRRQVHAASLAGLVAIGVVVSGWGVKQIGIHYALRRMNHVVRRDWATVDDFIQDNAIRLDTPARRALKVTLERAALAEAPVPELPEFPWGRAWFDENQ